MKIYKNNYVSLLLITLLLTTGPALPGADNRFNAFDDMPEIMSDVKQPKSLWQEHGAKLMAAVAAAVGIAMIAALSLRRTGDNIRQEDRTNTPSAETPGLPVSIPAADNAENTPTMPLTTSVITPSAENVQQRKDGRQPAQATKDTPSSSPQGVQKPPTSQNDIHPMINAFMSNPQENFAKLVKDQNMQETVNSLVKNFDFQDMFSQAQHILHGQSYDVPPHATQNETPVSSQDIASTEQPAKNTPSSDHQGVQEASLVKPVEHTQVPETVDPRALLAMFYSLSQMKQADETPQQNDLPVNNDGLTQQKSPWAAPHVEPQKDSVIGQKRAEKEGSASIPPVSQIIPTATSNELPVTSPTT